MKKQKERVKVGRLLDENPCMTGIIKVDINKAEINQLEKLKNEFISNSNINSVDMSFFAKKYDEGISVNMPPLKRLRSSYIEMNKNLPWFDVELGKRCSNFKKSEYINDYDYNSILKELPF